MKPAAVKLIVFVFIISSCTKEKEIPHTITISPVPPVVTEPPVFYSQFNVSLSESPVTIHSVINTRGGGNMDITGFNDNAKVDIRIRRITQTGNSSGLILIGFYDVVYAEKNKEGGWREYYSKDERLGIYNDRPLTDSIVSGYFSAIVSVDSNFSNPQKLKGDFKVRY